MNVDQLRTALEAESPGRDEVLTRLATKRRGRRKRQFAALGAAGLAVAVVGTVAGVLVSSHTTGGPNPTPSPAASGCGPLVPWLKSVSANGQSVVEAYGSLTGQSRLEGASPFMEMHLRAARTLAGPPLRPSLTVWLRATPQRAPSAADTPGLWGLDGHLLAVVTPARVAGTTVGPVATVAPVVRGMVILSSAGCWSDSALEGVPFTGHLAEVPGSGAYSLAAQSGGLHQVPLSTVAGLLKP